MSLAGRLRRLLAEGSGTPETVVDEDAHGRTRVRLLVGGEIVGALVFDRNPVTARGERWAKVWTVAVTPSRRGQGYGAELYRQALKNLPPGVAGISSSPRNRINNVEIPRIYRRLGAERVGSQYFLRREDTP